MPARKKVSQIVSLPAPIGGWNVRDPLPMMDAAFAPTLDNCFCLPSEIMVRKGYVEWATFEGNCNTLLRHNDVTGTDHLFAAVDNGGECAIYDVTTDGEKTVPEIDELTSAYFKQTHLSTSGGNFSYYVNNADPAILYDGTTWHSVTSSSTPYAITGPSDTIFRDVVTFKRRLWFTPDDSLVAWYLPVDQIAGAAVQYNFAPIFPLGGKIIKIDTWSLDAGTGLDDHMVIFTSEGEVAVYSGTDPASASTWSLVGVFQIGSPTGTGHACKYGGDLLIVNRDGIAQMSKSLMSSRVSTQLQLTDKIQPQLAKDTTKYAALPAWDMLLYPPENMLLVNIPAGGGRYYQYVMNTISGAWARWKDLPSRCWQMSDEELWFGSNGFVAKAWTNQNDNGAVIQAEIIPAYQHFGLASQSKRFSLARVIFGTTGQVTYGVRMEVDFNPSPRPITIPFSPSLEDAIYDISKYDESVYGSGLKIKGKWQNVSNIGYWGSLHIAIKTRAAEAHIYSYDVAVEAGGVL
jgi:hypothetical protein